MTSKHEERIRTQLESVRVEITSLTRTLREKQAQERLLVDLLGGGEEPCSALPFLARWGDAAFHSTGAMGATLYLFSGKLFESRGRGLWGPLIQSQNGKVAS